MAQRAPGGDTVGENPDAPELPDEVLAEKIFRDFGLEELIDLRQTCKQWNRVVLTLRRFPPGVTNLRQCVVQTFKKRMTGNSEALLPAQADGEPAVDEDADDEGSDRDSSEDEEELHNQQVAADWVDYFGCPIAAHRPVPDEDDWYYGMTPWAEDPDVQPYGYQSVKLVDSEGPFLLHLAKLDDADDSVEGGGSWVVQNPLGMTYYILPPQPEPDCLGQGLEFHVECMVKLIPGAAAADDAALDAGVFNYRAVAVTVAVAKGSSQEDGWIYAHMYTRATDDWKLLSRAGMGDKHLWPCTNHWRVQPHCFHGNSLYCSFHAEQQLDAWEDQQERLWALDTVLGSWTLVGTEDLLDQNAMTQVLEEEDIQSLLVCYRYVVCCDKLLAIARYVSAASPDGEDLEELKFISIYQYCVPTRKGRMGTWNKLSDMPVSYVGQLQGFDFGSCHYPVASPFIYFGGLSISSRIMTLVFDVLSNGWKDLVSAYMPDRMQEGVALEPHRFISMAPSRDAVP